MNTYTFEYPYLLLLLLPIIWCLYKCKEYLQQKYFVHLELLPVSKRVKNLDFLLIILLFTLLLFTLASPIVIDKLNPLNRFGKDIVVAIDASGSMNASGFDQENELSEGKRLSRFALTKMIAREFILKRVNDNVGVVIYGDFAFIASPITYEKEIVSDMLEYVTQGMAGQNTAIGDAIAMSVRAFRYSQATSKILILLSDGEHNSGALSPKDALALAKEAGVKIYTISIGEADSALMQKIAQESGGVFYNAKNAKELEGVYSAIDTLESSKIDSKEYKLKKYFYQSFLITGLLILLILLYRELKK